MHFDKELHIIWERIYFQYAKVEEIRCALKGIYQYPKESNGHTHRIGLAINERRENIAVTGKSSHSQLQWKHEVECSI